MQLGLRSSASKRPGLGGRVQQKISARTALQAGALYSFNFLLVFATHPRRCFKVARALNVPFTNEEGSQEGKELRVEDKRRRKEEKRIRKEACKQFEREHMGQGKLWLLHWHQSSLPSTSELDTLVSCYRADLKLLEKVSKHSIWFVSTEAQDGHHIFLVTPRPKDAFKYNLLELPSSSEFYAVPLPYGADVEIPVAALRQQLLEREAPGTMSSVVVEERALAESDCEASSVSGDEVGQVPPQSASIDSQKSPLSGNVIQLGRDMHKKGKQRARSPRLASIDMDSFLSQLEDVDPDADLQAQRLMGLLPSDSGGSVDTPPIVSLARGVALRTMSDDRDISNMLMLSTEDTEASSQPSGEI